MCLAIPGIVESIFEQNKMRMGTVNFGGIRRVVCFPFTPEVEVGNYVLVHVGFALSIVNEEEAKQTLAFVSDAEKNAELFPGENYQ